MIVFADSSAIVKLYADEQDHQLVRGLASADAAVLVAAFGADYHGSTGDQPRFAVVAVSPSVLDTAARLAGVHDLRAFDAVQLASAKAAAQAVPDCHTVTAIDDTLRAAAAAESFALLPE